MWQKRGCLLRTQARGLLLSHLVGSFQHLHQEGVNRRVAYQLEEEQVLQALQADGAKGWQAKQELGKPRKEHGVRTAAKVPSGGSHTSHGRPPSIHTWTWTHCKAANFFFFGGG